MPVVKLKARLVDVFNIRQESTTRTSWMANNAMPDSIIMNMICRSLVPPVGPKVLSTEVGLTSRNTLRILNTIKPVIRVFTAMDKVKLVIITGSKGTCPMAAPADDTMLFPKDPSLHLSIAQAKLSSMLPKLAFKSIFIEKSDPSHVARGDIKLRHWHWRIK